MRLCLTTPAARQLDRVLTYIAQHNPQGAHRVRERLSDVLNVLLYHPYAGHGTARPSIHRMVESPYPYAITYRVMGEEIVVLGVRHTARRPLA